MAPLNRLLLYLEKILANFFKEYCQIQSYSSIQSDFKTLIHLLKRRIHHRTVIVTAAVHQILDRGLTRLAARSLPILNYWHWAGVSPYTSSFDLAGTCVFVKQSLSVFCCNPVFLRGRTSPISYVQLSLPSSLRIVLPIAFVYSTRPPVSVYGTVKIVFLHGSFLGNRKLLTYVIITRINAKTYLTIFTCLLFNPNKSGLAIPTSSTLDGIFKILRL